MKTRIKETVLALVMFIFGFAWAKVYVPAIACYVLIYNRRALSWKMSQLAWLNYIASILFVFAVYLLGFNELTVDSPIGTFLVVLFLTIFMIPIFNSLSLVFSFRLVILFIFGIFIYVGSVVSYSLLTDPIGFYVRRLLLNPFNLEGVYNSPLFSNYLVLVYFSFLYLLFIVTCFWKKVIVVIGLIITLLMAVSLGGRTFFLVSFMFTALFSIKLNRRKTFLYLPLIMLFLFSSLFLLNNEFPFVAEGLISKFDNGIESMRFAHWAYALEQIPTHPLGGFTVNQQMEEIYSFHNIIFDSARLGGWIPVLLLFIPFVITVTTGVTLRSSDKHVLFFLFLAFILISLMMQDVILEGTYKMLLLYTLMNNLVLKFGLKNSK